MLFHEPLPMLWLPWLHCAFAAARFNLMRSAFFTARGVGSGCGVREHVNGLGFHSEAACSSHKPAAAMHLSRRDRELSEDEEEGGGGGW
jgi:hypothetical protein